MVMRGITNRAILGVISGLSRVSIPEIVAEILKTLNCLLLQQDCAQQFQCVSKRSNIVLNGLEPLSGPFFLSRPAPQEIHCYVSCFHLLSKIFLLTTKITTIAVINYNLVKVQFSYFVYKNT